MSALVGVVVGNDHVLEFVLADGAEREDEDARGEAGDHGAGDGVAEDEGASGADQGGGRTVVRVVVGGAFEARMGRWVSGELGLGLGLGSWILLGGDGSSRDTVTYNGILDICVDCTMAREVL